jgi:hypothetical protein
LRDAFVFLWLKTISFAAKINLFEYLVSFEEIRLVKKNNEMKSYKENKNLLNL